MKIGRKTEKSVVQLVLFCIFLTFLSFLFPVPYTSTLPAMGQNNPKHPKLKEFFNKAKETIKSVGSYKPTWESHYKDGVKALQEKRYESAQSHLEDALVLAEDLPDREAKVAATKQILAICLRDKVAFIKHTIPFVPPIKGDLLLGMTIFFSILAIVGYGYANGANGTDPLWVGLLALFLIVMGVGSTILYGPLSEIERLEKRIVELK
jgi:hypothetical protein